VSRRAPLRGALALAAALAAALTLAACHSPEAARTRGGGRGADPGNREPVVRMHAGSEVYYETPCLMPSDKCTGPLPTSGLPGDFPDSTKPKRR
jgi:hypothetical protein